MSHRGEGRGASKQYSVWLHSWGSSFRRWVTCDSLRLSFLLSTGHPHWRSFVSSRNPAYRTLLRRKAWQSPKNVCVGGLLSTWCITILSATDSFCLCLYSRRSWTAFIPVRMLFTRRLWNYWNLTPRTGQTDFVTKQMACAAGVRKDIKGEGDSRARNPITSWDLWCFSLIPEVKIYF